MKVPKALVTALRNEHVVLLATHINPDGDALGSCLALAEALEFLGKKVFVYDRDKVPEQYRFLPGHRRFRTDTGPVAGKDPLLVLLDCNSPERAGLEQNSYLKSAVIDHHVTESDFGRLRWIDRKAAATGLMVYALIRSMKVPVTKSMATNLYVALAVDTGTFRYSNTGPEVLKAGAELVEAGARPGLIAEHLYERWTMKRFDLLNKSLLTLDIRDGIALLHVTKDMMEKTGTSEADTENFANVPRMIDSVMISALIRESDNGRWKVSMRSKGSANVEKIAQACGGGGHRNAAGFRMKSDLETVRKIIFREGRKILRDK